MNKALRSSILTTLLRGTALLTAWQVHAEPTRVTFPANLDQMVHYTTVTRAKSPNTC